MKSYSSMLPKYFAFKIHTHWNIRRSVQLVLLMFFPLLMLLCFSQRVKGQNIQCEEVLEKLYFLKNKPVVRGNINGHEVFLLIDTGSSRNILDERYAHKFHFRVIDLPIPKRGVVIGVTGNRMQARRAYKLKCFVGKQEIKSEFLTLDLSNVLSSLGMIKGKPIIGMIGTEVLKKYGLILDFSQACIKMEEKVNGNGKNNPFKYTLQRVND